MYFYRIMKYPVLVLFFFLIIIEGPAQDRWSFELHGGVAGNLRLPLRIMQDGYPDIYIPAAHFASEPLISPWYWDWRFTRWKNSKSIEFEAIHHKLFLVNKPPEVQRFGISHGFNMLFFNRSFQKSTFVLRPGLGSVLVHPESTVRNQVYPEGPGFDMKGYRLRGVALNLAIARPIDISRHFFINIEGKVTTSYVWVPIQNGSARLWNVAFQFIIGPGVNWAVKSPNMAD